MTSTPLNAVYKIKPLYGSSQIILKMTGYVKKDDDIIDEIIELDAIIHPEPTIYGKNAIPLKSYNGYDMYGVIFRCKIIDTFISFNNRYPLMYLAVNYKKSVLYGSLLQVIISVDVSKDEKKQIKHKNFNDVVLSGTYVQHIDCDAELYPTLEATNDQNTDNQFTISKEQNINFKSIKQTRDNLIALCTSDVFYKILQEAIKCRDKQRQDTLLKDFEKYEVPEHVYKLDTLEKELLQNDEVIFD